MAKHVGVVVTPVLPLTAQEVLQSGATAPVLWRHKFSEAVKDAETQLQQLEAAGVAVEHVDACDVAAVAQGLSSGQFTDIVLDASSRQGAVTAGRAFSERVLSMNLVCFTSVFEVRAVWCGGVVV